MAMSRRRQIAPARVHTARYILSLYYCSRCANSVSSSEHTHIHTQSTWGRCRVSEQQTQSRATCWSPLHTCQPFAMMDHLCTVCVYVWGTGGPGQVVACWFQQSRTVLGLAWWPISIRATDLSPRKQHSVKILQALWLHRGNERPKQPSIYFLYLPIPAWIGCMAQPHHI